MKSSISSNYFDKFVRKNRILLIFSIMNYSFLLLICGSVFLQSFVLARPKLTYNGQLSEENQDKLGDYAYKAIEGFRKMMPKGDHVLDYPVMDPYKLEDIHWNYVDKSGNNSYNLTFSNTNVALIKGLSNFQITSLGVGVTEIDMFANIQVKFENLTAEIPYKLDGHMFNHILPIHGEGLAELYARWQVVVVGIRLDIVKMKIFVKKAGLVHEGSDIKVRATGLMNLPEEFVNPILEQTLRELTFTLEYERALTHFARSLVEQAVGGMTISEFFEYIDHFAKKSDEK